MFQKAITQDSLGLIQPINFISIKIMIDCHLNIIFVESNQSFIK